MKTKIILILLVPFLFFSCSKDEIVLEDEIITEDKSVVIITENFGLRALSWVHPYLKAKSVVFKSENGDIEVFDITISDIVARKHIFNHGACEYRNFTFVSKTNPAKRFIMSPLGNSALYFSAEPINHPFNPELFTMVYNPLNVSQTFMVRLIYKNADVPSFDYKYSTSYPKGLDEELEVTFDTKSNSLFSTIKMKQGEGLISYRDKDGILWTQHLEIRN